MSAPIAWPGGKTFAFTVFDDTDASTVANTKPVYDFLRELGFRTTKSVWPLAGTEPPAVVGGSTCAEPDYLAWLKTLQAEGFEIGYHNATFHSSKRAQTAEAISRFAELFGHDPHSMANHTICREGIYWGGDRVSGIHRSIYHLLNRQSGRDWFRGHVEGDEYFWGDLCRQRVRYVRNFVFASMDTLASCPFMPYHDPERPFVNSWYASSEGGNVESFIRTIDEASQDRLEEAHSACIMYTHFAKGFFKDGNLNARFKLLMERLSRKNGWFVPVHTLLEFLRERNGGHTITPSERRALERRWLFHKFRVGTT
jgi:hypothetical protein